MKFFSGHQDITDLLRDPEIESIAVVEIGLKEDCKRNQMHSRKQFFTEVALNYSIDYYIIFLEGSANRSNNHYISIKTTPPKGYFPIKKGSKHTRPFLDLPRSTQGIYFECSIQKEIISIVEEISEEYNRRLVACYLNVNCSNRRKCFEIDAIVLFKWRLLSGVFKYKLEKRLTQ